MINTVTHFRILRYLFISVVFLSPASLAANEVDAPLIDRDLFFADPLYANAQLSPDGKWISFLKPYRGIMNIWVKKYEQSFEQAWPVTADDKRPVRQYFWSRDSASILHVQDQGGDENFHVYALDPESDIRSTSATEPRDLTPHGEIRALIYSVPKSTPDHILVGINDRDPRLHDVYRISISNGERELVVENKDFIASWHADLNGTVRLAVKQDQSGGTQIFKVEGDQVKDMIYECNYLENCGAGRFHKDGKRFYMVGNKGDDFDLSRLLLVNAQTGATELVESDPEDRVDFSGSMFSEVSDELIATIYNDERIRIYWHDDEAEARWQTLKSKLPDGEIRLVSTTADESRFLLRSFSDTNPGSIYAFDSKTGDLNKLYDSRPDLPNEHLVSMRPIRYPARDGVEIPAYLTLPRTEQAKDLPAVILPHGGPWARDSWNYNSFTQFLANRGYAVLQPNFRGSTGYGKGFLNAGNWKWGTGVMQDDISDGVAYLIAQGIADPERVAIMGGSYGGYATLAGVTFTPDLYAAGVSIVGPSNLLTLLESIPPYWEPMKKTFALRVGDLETEAGRAQLKSQSPFFHAKAIKAPMLIVQGANDPRVKQAESDQIVVALRDAGRPVEYLLADNEGHGYANEDNRMVMFASIEKFLAKHIGGRYQADMKDNIAERLRELKVDVSEVTIKKAG